MQKKLLASKKKHPTFITGFIDWKDATTAFQKHQCSKCHQETTEAALFCLPRQIQGDIGEMLNHEHQA